VSVFYADAQRIALPFTIQIFRMLRSLFVVGGTMLGLVLLLPHTARAQAKGGKKASPTRPRPAAKLPVAGLYNLSASATHFSVYFKWDEVPGAMFYRITNAAGKEIFDGGGLDAFDAILAPGQTYTYTLLPYHPQSKQAFAPTRVTATTAVAKPTATAMRGDYTSLSGLVVAAKGRVSGYKFSPADVGKCLSLEACRYAPEYREAPLWWHGIITSVTASGTAEVEASYGGAPLPKNGVAGYVATNNYDQWCAALTDTGTNTLQLSGTYLIDPFRSEWWRRNVKDVSGNANMGPQLNHAALLISGGTLVFGHEDALGDRLNAPPPPYYWQPMPLIGILHQAGTLGLRCNVRGPLTPPFQNRSGYAVSKFYQSASTSTVKQVFFSGVFGDSGNYGNGFFTAFDLRGPKPNGGKSVLAILDASVACGMPFGVATAADADRITRVTPYEGYRFMLRDVRVLGCGFGRATPTVKATVSKINATEARITVDPKRFPNFSFMQWEWNEPFNVLMKPIGASPGGTHQFQNVVWRQTKTVEHPYSAVVSIGPGAATNEHLRQAALIYGPVELTTTGPMQPSIGIEGHVLYHNIAEIDINRVHLSNLNMFFIRQNGADNLQGQYRQWGIKNLTYTPPVAGNRAWMKTDWSYFLQMATNKSEPFIQHQGMGFVGKAKLSNIEKLMLHTHIDPKQYEVQNSSTNLYRP
jgi:hypothetical protein